MTLKNYTNVMIGVNNRFTEIVELLAKLRHGEDVDFEYLLDLIKQSHYNELRLISAYDRIEENNNSIDIPEFMKRGVLTRTLLFVREIITVYYERM